MLDISSILTTKWAQKYKKKFCIKYSMYDLICDVITYCIWFCDTAKIDASDKILFETHKERENMEIKEFYINLNLKDCLDIRSLLRQADARGTSADIIYRIWRISLFCESGIVIEVRK